MLTRRPATGSTGRHGGSWSGWCRRGCARSRSPREPGWSWPLGPGRRAARDPLPMPDEKDVPYRSTVPNACHACGHDVHTTVLLGTGLFLAARAAGRSLPGRIRLIFQPAEEVPGGALDVMAAGHIASVERIFALHCDPSLEVGK